MDKPFKYIISPEISSLRNFSPKLKIAILASGEGTNFQKLIDLSRLNKFDVDIKILITNNSNAGCILRAQKSNIPYKVIKSTDHKSKNFFEDEIVRIIKKNDVELVVKIINIHPSLLPSFKGNNAIKEAISNGSKITGCSVHFVETEVDSGALIMQAALSISDDENIEIITKKIHLLEHKILAPSISIAGYIIRKNFKDKD